MHLSASGHRFLTTEGTGCPIPSDSHHDHAYCTKGRMIAISPASDLLVRVEISVKPERAGEVPALSGIRVRNLQPWTAVSSWVGRSGWNLQIGCSDIGMTPVVHCAHKAAENGLGTHAGGSGLCQGNWLFSSIEPSTGCLPVVRKAQCSVLYHARAPSGNINFASCGKSRNSHIARPLLHPNHVDN